MLSLNHGYGLTLNSVYYESIIWSPLCKSNIIINLKCLVHILQRSMSNIYNNIAIYIERYCYI